MLKTQLITAKHSCVEWPYKMWRGVHLYTPELLFLIQSFLRCINTILISKLDFCVLTVFSILLPFANSTLYFLRGHITVGDPGWISAHFTNTVVPPGLLKSLKVTLL